MNTPSEEKVSMKDLIWRVPAIGFCVWLSVASILATDNVPQFGVKAAVLISAVWWASLAASLVKATVTISSTPKDEE